MTTALITHQACLSHVPPPGHPECPERLRAVWEAENSEEFQWITRMEAPLASHESLLRVHGAAFVERILGPLADEAAAGGYVFLDPDTAMSAGSAQAALRAAGAVTAAVDLVMAGEAANAFCAVRPPGHHASADRAMGFCIFNNVAVGAAHARVHHGLARVGIVDFDVHHGNGTQDIFYNEPEVFYASTHQSPFYPGTGAPSEHGVAGNVLNVPLPAGAGSAAFRAAFGGLVLPALEKFAPEFLFISAGFDAHERDPLGELCLKEEDFGWATAALCDVAARCCAGRVVSVLEGGYDADALGRSARAHLSALTEA